MLERLTKNRNLHICRKYDTYSLRGLKHYYTSVLIPIYLLYFIYRIGIIRKVGLENVRIYFVESNH